MSGASIVSRKYGHFLASRGARFGLLSVLALVGCDSDGGDSKGDGGSGGDGDSNMDGGGGGGNKDGAVPGGDGDDGPNGGDGGQTTDPDAGPLCSPACADTNNCTADECVATNTCTHELEPSMCPQGQSCHPMKGCSAGAACSMPSDCADQDGCTTNERCDGASATCQFDPLDGDDDGFAPTVCGGGDCNDEARNVNPGETERCNNQDDDCDGMVDDNAECSGGRICVSGSCVCPEGQMQCGGGGGGGGGPITCADLKTNADHCGECGNDCGPAGVCSNSQCTCPAPGTMCGDSCVNTQTTFEHCGGCGMECDLQPLEACVAGGCVACGNAGQACCAPLGPFQGCLNGLSCSGTPNTAGAVCQCASPNTMCGAACVDTKTNEDHCGGCGQECQQGQQCKANAAGTGTCTDCGGMGEDCCQFGGFGACFGGGLTCNQDTQKCVAGGGPGGPGGGGPGNN